jgi:hypothetical protein
MASMADLAAHIMRGGGQIDEATLRQLHLRFQLAGPQGNDLRKKLEERKAQSAPAVCLAGVRSLRARSARLVAAVTRTAPASLTRQPHHACAGPL